MDTSDHKQLINAHAGNIRHQIQDVITWTARDRFDDVVDIIRPIIQNARKIRALAAELHDEQTKRKDQDQCSPAQAK